VIPGSFVGSFIEAPNEILEDESHLDVVDSIRMQIHLCKLGDDEIEPVRLLHLLYFLVELKLVEDVADVLRKPADVVLKVPTHVVRVAFELLKIQWAVIMKSQFPSVGVFCDLVESWIKTFKFTASGKFCMSLQDLSL